ncbi:MAG: mRNA surveillance protein pelota [Thermoplasmatota archaeon]|nr:mRNA surveillance protein pelota [Candidatus Thermoplasmatota archaeon]MBU1913666.1 mRNA surveillance protein pelota [Candidatus Thermoplasmatota archaeon]
MKVLHQDTRTNEIKLFPETLDDLWHLYNLVDDRDLVFASTYRRGEEKTDKLRAERVEKVRMRLGIRVQKVEFHESEDVLRILGAIEQGPQDMGQHHTLMISVGEPLTIIKPDWKPQHFDRIKRAIEMSEKPSMFFVAIEDTDAVIATAREYGLKEFATITRNPGGKMYDSKPNELEFLDEVVEKLKMVMHGEPLIVLGPGFVKEALAKRLREKAPGISSSMVIHHTGQAGMAGINEIMKQGIGGKVLDETRVARETRLMELLFSEIGKNGMFAYGDESVKSAVVAGAVSVLLVLDTKVRSSAADGLIRMVEGSKGEFVIVSSLHEAGRRLDSLGGVAALLRYRMS